MGATQLNRRMLRCCGFLALLLAALPNRQLAQFEPANPVQLVVNVYIGSLQNPASSNLTVQLLDRFGLIEKEQHTDNSGRVEFQTRTATKRLRIFGPGIEEHTEVLDIEAVENRKMVRIIVAAKTGGGTRDADPAWLRDRFCSATKRAGEGTEGIPQRLRSHQEKGVGASQDSL